MFKTGMMARKSAAVVLAFLLLTGQVAGKENNDEGWCYWKIGGAVVGGIGTLVAAPVVIAAAGFGAGGIAAGSVAASAMSASATYGVGGGLVAAAQSAGAAGLGVLTKVVIGGVGSYAGSKVAEKYGACDVGDKRSDEKQKECRK